MNVLAFNGVTKQYGDKMALDHFDWQVTKGEVHGLLGHNGAGKTTAFLIANGLITFEKGAVSALGSKPEEGNRKFSLLTENLKLYTDLCFRELHKVMCKLYSVPQHTSFQQELINELNLDSYFKNKTKIANYSTGMRKKAYLFFLLIQVPEVIFLDEPFAGLDPVAVTEMSNAILRLNQTYGMTFIVSSHNLNEIEKTCQKITIVKEGHVCVSDQISKILGHFSEERQYSIEYIKNNKKLSVSIIGLERLYRKLGELKEKEYLVTDICEKKISLNDIYLRYYESETPNVVNKIII